MEKKELKQVIADVIRTNDYQIVPYSPENMQVLKQSYKLKKIALKRTDGYGSALVEGEFIKVFIRAEKERYRLPDEWKTLIKYYPTDKVLRCPLSLANLVARYARSIKRFAYKVTSSESGAAFIIQDQKR